MMRMMTHGIGVGLLFLGLIVATSVKAALPPYWQRAAEISAILNDRPLAGALKNKPVDRIEWRSAGLYRVSTGQCRIDVKAVEERQTRPGPAKFRIEAGRATCR